MNLPRCPICKNLLNSYMIKYMVNKVLKWEPVRPEERHCRICNKIVKIEDSVIKVGKMEISYEKS